MRTIHYGICFALVLIMVSLLYGCVIFFFHLTVQLPILLMLPLTTLCVERLWALLKWMSPVIGTVDTREQERTRTRIVEYELSRALRYGSPLVIAAIREKTRTSSHVVSKNIRNTDIVLRMPAGYLMVIMPETSLQQAKNIILRLTTLLSIKDVVLADEAMLQATIPTQRTGNRNEARGITAREFRIICTKAFEMKMANITDSGDENGNTMIYTIFDSKLCTGPLYIPERALTCPIPSLNEPVDNKRITRILKDFIMADSEKREV